MKSFQVFAILAMLVFLFAAGKEVVAAGADVNSCSEALMIEPCEKAVCTGLCKRRHGAYAIGACLGDGCLCNYPCPSL